jgi:hypothetical protein
MDDTDRQRRMAADPELYRDHQEPCYYTQDEVNLIELRAVREAVERERAELEKAKADHNTEINRLIRHWAEIVKSQGAQLTASTERVKGLENALAVSLDWIGDDLTENGKHSGWYSEARALLTTGSAPPAEGKGPAR